MDLNIATTFVNNDQDNNQTLFNDLKDKFDARTTTSAAASPPKFNIPLLKIPVCDTLENTQAIQTNKSPTQLNKFLIKKLQEKHSTNDLSGSNNKFVLPNLSALAENRTTVKYELPAFPSQAEDCNLYSLTTAINKLKVQENSNTEGDNSLTTLPAAIDLTTALASKFDTHRGTTIRDLKKSQQNDVLDFEIPFIDCDRDDVSSRRKRILPAASNEYCVQDVSQLILHHSLAEPSVVGRFLSADNKRKYLGPLKSFTSQLRPTQVKHNIEPFRFDTQSPDDVVLLALSKYQRRHHN